MSRLSPTAQANLIAALVVGALVILALPACGEPERPAPPTIELPALPEPAATRAQPATPEEAERRAARAALAQAQARVDAAEAAVRDARQEASLAPLRATAVWATWAGGVLALLAGLGWCLALWWQLPVGRKTLAGLALGGVLLAALAQALVDVSPYLAVLGLGILALGLLAGLGFGAWRLVTLARAATAHADRLERWTLDQPGIQPAAMRAAVHSISASEQLAAGIHTAMARLRGKARP